MATNRMNSVPRTVSAPSESRTKMKRAKDMLIGAAIGISAVTGIAASTKSAAENALKATTEERRDEIEKEMTDWKDQTAKAADELLMASVAVVQSPQEPAGKDVWEKSENALNRTSGLLKIARSVNNSVSKTGVDFHQIYADLNAVLSSASAHDKDFQQRITTLITAVKKMESQKVELEKKYSGLRDYDQQRSIFMGKLQKHFKREFHLPE